MGFMSFAKLKCLKRKLRTHFKTWYDRCGVSVKRTVFYVGFLQCGSALASLRYPNVGFEMRSKYLEKLSDNSG
jgi:hypothetical protein